MSVAALVDELPGHGTEGGPERARAGRGRTRRRRRPRLEAGRGAGAAPGRSRGRTWEDILAGFARRARLRADALDARAAHPPRTRDEQHLHESGPPRTVAHDSHDAARPSRFRRSGRTLPRQGEPTSPGAFASFPAIHSGFPAAPSFNEFAVRVRGGSAARVCEALEADGIIAGYDLGRTDRGVRQSPPRRGHGKAPARRSRPLRPGARTRPARLTTGAISSRLRDTRGTGSETNPLLTNERSVRRAKSTPSTMPNERASFVPSAASPRSVMPHGAPSTSAPSPPAEPTPQKRS